MDWEVPVNMAGPPMEQLSLQEDGGQFDEDTAVQRRFSWQVFAIGDLGLSQQGPLTELPAANYS